MSFGDYKTIPKSYGIVLPITTIDDLSLLRYVNIAEPQINGAGALWQVLVNDKDAPTTAKLYWQSEVAPGLTLCEHIWDNGVSKDKFIYKLVVSKATSLEEVDAEKAKISAWLAPIDVTDTIYTN